MTRKNALIISAGALLAVVIGCALLFYLGLQKGPSGENRELKVTIARRQAPASKTQDATEKPIEDVRVDKQTAAVHPLREAGGDPEGESANQNPPDTLAVSQPSRVIQEAGTQSQSTKEKPSDSQLSMGKEPGSEEVSETSLVASVHSSSEQIQAATVSGDTQARVDRPVIRRAAIALGVGNREPLGIIQRVSVHQHRVYCWMHIINGQGEEITVRWIRKGKKAIETRLPVGSNSWRTWAYASLRPGMIGPAQVEILGENGELLKTLSFEVTE
jgi:hypothetical protein